MSFLSAVARPAVPLGRVDGGAGHQREDAAGLVGPLGQSCDVRTPESQGSPLRWGELGALDSNPMPGSCVSYSSLSFLDYKMETPGPAPSGS